MVGGTAQEAVMSDRLSDEPDLELRVDLLERKIEALLEALIDPHLEMAQVISRLEDICQ